MKLDCACGGWTAFDARRDTDEAKAQGITLEPRAKQRIPWTCALCGRRVCHKCEGTHSGIAALDRVCDHCWEGVCALLMLAVRRLTGVWVFRKERRRGR